MSPFSGQPGNGAWKPLTQPVATCGRVACAHVQPATVKAHAPDCVQVSNIRLRPSPLIGRATRQDESHTQFGRYSEYGRGAARAGLIRHFGLARPSESICRKSLRPSMISAAEIRRRSCEAAFGQPLVMNVLRGLVVEAIVATALEPDWIWRSANYASWDFEAADGCRLEVKQSAVRQSWKAGPGTVSRCRWDIAKRTGRYNQLGWVPAYERSADLYVLAFHSVEGELADHRDPAQWHFFVIPARALPEARSIGLESVRKITGASSYEGLAAEVARTSADVRSIGLRRNFEV